MRHDQDDLAQGFRLTAIAVVTAAVVASGVIALGRPAVQRIAAEPATRTDLIRAAS